jgi:hypothetical protein
MQDVLQKKWTILTGIAVIVIVAGMLLYFRFFNPAHVYLKLSETGYDLKGAHVIADNFRIGKVTHEVKKIGFEGRVFRISFDQTIHIPANSAVSVRKSVLDSTCTVFLTLVPSRNYIGKGDTLFVSAVGIDKSLVRKEVPGQTDTLQPASEKKEAVIEGLEPGYNEIIFMVQLMASKEPVDEKHYQFKGIHSIRMIRENGWYKYFTGETDSFEKVSETREQVVSAGLTDAFVVAYRGSQRISVNDAVSLKKIE